MERNVLEQHFCKKISTELKEFQDQILQLTKQEIYDLAYRIDYTIRIYEILGEQSQRLETEQLSYCLKIPSLLAFLYGEWLKVPGSQMEDEEQVIWHLIQTDYMNSIRKETFGE